MILPVCTYPDPVLAKKAVFVEHVDKDINRLIDDMFETMYENSGIGLAANQVDKLVRVIVIHIDQSDNPLNEPFAVINPEIIKSDGEIVFEEGCLSLPNYTNDVKRAASITVTGLGQDGKQLEIDAQGLAAVCLQHEIDHLDGRLFIDRISRLKRELYKRRVKKELAERKGK